MGFTKKAVLTIFASALFCGSAFATDVKLSGNYIVSLTVSPPSETFVTVPVFFQAKVTPSKAGVDGKITVTRSSDGVEGVSPLAKGEVVSYSNTSTKMIVSAPLFKVKHRTLDPIVGGTSVSVVNGGGKQFTIYYGDIDSKMVAHYATIHSRIERTDNPLNGLITGDSGLDIIPSPAYIEFTGTLVRQ